MSSKYPVKLERRKCKYCPETFMPETKNNIMCLKCGMKTTKERRKMLQIVAGESV